MSSFVSCGAESEDMAARAPLTTDDVVESLRSTRPECSRAHCTSHRLVRLPHSNDHSPSPLLLGPATADAIDSHAIDSRRRTDSGARAADAHC
eukprot:2575703-Pleurochrysis_carterae.AAC.1